ncbi:MAG TPA: 2-hydroxyacyl-CoA dehydratase [Desulfobacteraceae bacterium]|nr:2-hydroxyacyl-CoA dehydratase [Desulfobacteraceae bacterium]HPJ67183.1 2-hydroxyacyl-CoA dehydratase [Desulfobacteraceae bacterium]HPQ26843.1 2-hydroxyacyl-CoA dehydratase [Desulfobacteraceae bacterium]
MNNTIGITATIPVEIIYAAGLKPVDLNNIFITSKNPKILLSQAEAAGFSHNICNWIKGIYATVLNSGIKTVIAVTGGDCSNTIALGELLHRRGVEVISFEYPLDRSRDALEGQFEKLRKAFSTTWLEIEGARSRLQIIRKKLRILDELTYIGNVVSGLENHTFLVNSSDFEGNPDEFEDKLDKFLIEAKQRKPRKEEIRLGYLGVPPIFSQFFEFIETLGARVVFNEVQRQFSMPFDKKELVDQYLEYTYPFDINGRIQDINQAIQERELDGLIHYTQTFCYRQIYDIILRESLKIPILTLEGDRPGPIDSRTALRIETFVDILSDPVKSSSR